MPDPKPNNANGRPNLAITRFDFQAKVFTVQGARFGLFGPRQEPRFFVTLGGMDVSLDLRALLGEFSIAPGSSDDQLIQLAAKSLKFVADIRPGDAIPSELLNGTASWSVEPRHREIAERRLQVQLLSWVSGKEVVLTDDDELKMFLEQIENKAKLRQAFEMAAEAVGRPRTDHEFVLYQLGSLARELCYIEALRERFAALSAIPRRLIALRAPYSGETRTREEVHRVTLLMGRAMASYTKSFEDVDAQTGEIIGALKSFERQIQFIRDTRDDLYFAFREWDVLISRWSAAELKKSRAMDSLISDTYRLLASRFAASRSMLKAA